jgi:hypothetical protein
MAQPKDPQEANTVYEAARFTAPRKMLESLIRELKWQKRRD